jgi:DNA polymerase-4/DNA polymerase V
LGSSIPLHEYFDRTTELGFTFSVGLAPTKVVAKVASKWEKPSGFTVIPGRELHRFLGAVSVEQVWGIGRQTTALLAKHGVRTALEFARRPEEWVTKRFTRPVVAIWQELNGNAVLPIETQPRETYASIQKVKTFTPASAAREMVYAQLVKNLENACVKARRYKLAAQRVLIFLRTQDFRDVGREVELTRPSCFPNNMLRAIAPAFDAVFMAGTSYRATGVILHHFSEAYYGQLDLFGEVVRMQRLSNLYESVDALSAKYGKHTLFLCASLPAHLHAQHVGERGELPERHANLLPGETARKRLGIPMFMGEVT